MTVITYATFRFIRNRGAEGRAFIDSQFSILRKQPGLLRMFLSQGAGDPDSFLIFTEWKDEECHNKMMQTLGGMLAGGTEFMKIMPILYSTPVMESYKIVKE